MRRVYSWLVFWAAPLAFAVVLWRGLRDRSYWQGLPERFGFGAMLPDEPRVWVHAVSLGEMSAAAPLVRALRARYPNRALLLTTSTPAGRARARALCGKGVHIRYLPYDTSGAMRRFLARTRPSCAVIMETELWPNLFAQCRRTAVPLLLASARLSARSVSRYRRWHAFMQRMLSQNVTIAAQSEEDSRRFQAIGAPPERIQVAGNVKFDIDANPLLIEQGRRLRESFGAARAVWIAGSTHAGEEQLVLAAHTALRRTRPDALLLLAPRHKIRFDAVADLLVREAVPFVRRSSGAAPAPECAVLLVDTLGELAALYAASDVAFVGGSLVPVGGHNLLEPAALGVPVLTGPSQWNAQDVARLLLAQGAACEVAGPSELAQALRRLVEHPLERRRFGEQAARLVAANRGSVAKLLQLIELIDPSLAAERPAAAH